MFPLALYVLKMAFFKTPLGKTFPELFYFTFVEAIKSAKPGQFLQLTVRCGIQQKNKMQLLNTDNEEHSSILNYIFE